MNQHLRGVSSIPVAPRIECRDMKVVQEVLTKNNRQLMSSMSNSGSTLHIIEKILICDNRIPLAAIELESM
jgi:hypothetical protein